LSLRVDRGAQNRQTYRHWPGHNREPGLDLTLSLVKGCESGVSKGIYGGTRNLFQVLEFVFGDGMTSEQCLV
jgi:hypothetical protein